MKNNNICKFILPGQEVGLSVSCFILETKLEVIHKKMLLTAHRMILVTKGEGSFFFGEQKTPFTAGNLIFGFNGENFHSETKKECEYMYIQFDGDRADELFRRFNIQKNNRCFSGFDSLMPLWKESLSRADKQTIDLVSESILLYTFSRLTGSIIRRDSLINKLIQLLEENFRDYDLSIASIAKELSYNPKYISHMFKEHIGISLTEYLKTLRIRYAVSLFDHGLDSVKNVALLSGFNDPYYFSTVFKKAVGVSPTDYARGKRTLYRANINCTLLPETINCRLPKPLSSTEETKTRASAL